MTRQPPVLITSNSPLILLIESFSNGNPSPCKVVNYNNDLIYNNFCYYQAGSAANSWFCEFVPRHLIRYEIAAQRAAIRTGLIVIQSRILPPWSSSTIPVSRAVRNAIKRPLIRSLRLTLKSFDSIIPVL